jgi:hypothetical protein
MFGETKNGTHSELLDVKDWQCRKFWELQACGFIMNLKIINCEIIGRI